MKKMLLTAGLILLLSLSVFASGNKDSGKAAGAAVDYNETGILKLDWHSSIGTDSLFECPWVSEGSLYPAMLFDTLLQNNNDGTVQTPRIATEWTVSEDGKTYTFTITDKAKWTDGTPLTIDDVLFSYNAVLKLPKSPKKGNFKNVVGAQDVIDGKADSVSGITVDGNKITFKLTQADNTVLSGLFAMMQILPKHLLKDADPATLASYEPYWTKPVGTGIFKIDEVSFPTYFTMVRNDDYFGEKAKIKHVLFTSHQVGGAEAIISDVIAGNLDYVYGNAINDINTAVNVLANNPDMKMRLFPGGYQRKFMFNLVGSQDGKYNDDVKKQEVRQAFRLIMDMKSFASLYPGQGIVLTTFVPSDMSKYNKNIPLFKRDVKKAISMLKDANFDFSRPVRILYYYGDQTTKDLMDILVQNFADAGVTAKPFLATGDLASIIYEVKNYDMIYLGGGGTHYILQYGALEPGSAFDKILGDVKYRSVYTDLLNKYKSTNDPAEIKALGDKIQKEAYNYAAIIPAYGLKEIVLYNAAKLKIDDRIFNGIPVNNYHFANWELVGK